MSSPGSDRVFAGSIPELYEAYMVPLIFAPYAEDLARRAAALRPARVLETAAGTGVVTRALTRRLEAGVDLLATDLNAPMLERAQAIGTAQPVRWQVADAQQLLLADASVDLVVCQFGAMFFPDKPRAFREARRVLRPGGTLLFNVWDTLASNEFTALVTETLAQRYPADPPRFMVRTPHGYADREAIARDLRAGGFSAAPVFETVAGRSRAASALVAATALCQGSPLRNEIEARDPQRLAQATAQAAAAIAARFGSGAVDGVIQAHIVAAAA